MGVKNDQISSKNVKKRHWKKPTVRDFSGPILTDFAPKVTYTDLSKNRPHKKHCAWARTPPLAKSGNLSKIMVFYGFGGLQ
jgi:hypothetical protein